LIPLFILSFDLKLFLEENLLKFFAREILARKFEIISDQ